MSNIQKKSKTVEDLEFLNGEISKLREVKKELEDSIVSLGLIQKEKEEQYKKQDNARGIRSISLDNQIAIKNDLLEKLSSGILVSSKELSSLETSIKENKHIVSETLASISKREIKVKEGEDDIRKKTLILDKQIQDKEKEKENNEKAKKELIERENLVESRENKLISSSKLLDDREKKVNQLEVDAHNLFSSNAGRADDINKQYQELNTERREFEMEKNDILFKKQKLKEESEININQLNNIKVKEKEIVERDRVSGIREQKSILKEEELRIREKRLSIKEQQNDLTSTSNQG